MQRLPDGSGFFVMDIGPREKHDLISRIKYHRKGYARKWLFKWRMFKFAYWEAADPLPFWKAIKYVASL
jgi:hypothetical protein